MVLERDIKNRQTEQEIVVCPPTTFGKLLAREFDSKPGKSLGKAPVHVIKVVGEEPQYLTLVDFPLKEDKLGLLLNSVSPRGRRIGPNFYSRSGIYADWKMPDIQSDPRSQKLLRIHKAAFPVEWSEFEQDRKILLQGLEGEDVILFPAITWTKGRHGVRRYDLGNLSPELFEICRQRLSFGHKFQLMFLTASVTRTFNSNLGLVTVAFLQPEIHTQWEQRQKLPIETNEDYQGYAQLITGAQMPLVVLAQKNQILVGGLFDKLEEYAQGF